MNDTDSINVEVAYALPHQQKIIYVNVKNDATLEDAILRSGIIDYFPEIDLTINKVGVFGKLSTLNTRLSEGDRIEIYRALIADPKEIRRKRAAEGKSMKKNPD